MPKSIHKRALKIMQLTMNSNEVSVSSNRPNRFFSWLSIAAKKIATVFTKKKTPVVSKELTEAIQAIEWRTRYDQQRIVRYIYTESLQKDKPELYRALNMSLPVKHFWSDEKVNIEITDNSFERKLVRLFGDLNPVTKQLLDGKKTETQRWVQKNARVMDLIPEMLGKSKSLLLNGYEQQILRALTAPIAIVHVPTTALALPLETVTPVKPEEKIIDMATETLPIEEITDQPIAVEQPIENKTVTLTEAEKLEKTIKGLKKLSLPDLKKFAIANNIHIRGKMTQITSIREKIVRELRKQAASQA